MIDSIKKKIRTSFTKMREKENEAQPHVSELKQSAGSQMSQWILI